MVGWSISVGIRWYRSIYGLVAMILVHGTVSFPVLPFITYCSGRQKVYWNIASDMKLVFTVFSFLTKLEVLYDCLENLQAKG